MPSVKPRRVRDPIHDMIPFSEHQLERVLWEAVGSRPFQRLRRIKQLGFSELTFPGACHSRFAHSLGVFHTARQLMRVLKRVVPTAEWDDHRERVALSAALVHDLGHGMFSHVFEKVGKELRKNHGLDLPLTKHEQVTSRIIEETEISGIFEPLGAGFASSVAKLIGQDGPQTLYDAVVSSQFDADRLDYMRRDRFMAGVQSGGIDFSWLLDNLKVGDVPRGTDDVPAEPLKTFVLGSKAIFAGEQYVLALFQLYPTIYYHKTTVAAEVVFTALMVRLFKLIAENGINKTGLDASHPIVKFVQEVDALEKAIALDDTVFWGALSTMLDAEDPTIAKLSSALYDRKLPKSIELEQLIIDAFPVEEEGGAGRDAEKAREKVREEIQRELAQWSDGNSDGYPRILVSAGNRNPYSLKEEKGPLNRIRVQATDGSTADIADHSPMVAALRPFEFFRAYVSEDDREAKEAVRKIATDLIDEEKRTLG